MEDVYIFISHSWKYPEGYTDLLSLLRRRGYFNFRDYSVPKDDPLKISAPTYYEAKLRREISEQLRPCQVVIVIAGKYASYSESMEMELEIAKSMGKPIIALKPFGATQISSVACGFANEVVSWNADSIVDAIRKYK